MKKRNRHLVDFTILANHRVKIKENEKIDKNLDLARELKRPWHMTVILIVFDSLGTVPKKFGKETERIRNQWKIQDHTSYNLV